MNFYLNNPQGQLVVDAYYICFSGGTGCNSSVKCLSNI